MEHTYLFIYFFRGDCIAPGMRNGNLRPEDIGVNYGGTHRRIPRETPKKRPAELIEIHGLPESTHQSLKPVA
jgi:hypothetical protein